MKREEELEILIFTLTKEIQKMEGFTHVRADKIVDKAILLGAFLLELRELQNK